VRNAIQLQRAGMRLRFARQAFLFVKLLVSFLASPIVAPRAVTRKKTERFGSVYGGWNLVPQGLDEASVVYSIGIGKDISFDLAIIHRFGLTVHGFDPTPASIQWVRSHEQPSRFIFHEIGAGGHDGTVQFDFPVFARTASLLLKAERVATGKKVSCKIMRISSLMRMLGHSKIDLLKMDIEGAEYDVIDDIVRSNLDITQILVEFHHRFWEGGLSKTRRAISALMDHGYLLCWVSLRGTEFAFLRDSSGSVNDDGARGGDGR
jgi:FkbM family methyltransferase